MILICCGARPNFMKIAPIIKELDNRKVEYKLIHTGQHYDKNMSDVFFDDLNIPKPDYNLGVRSSTHAKQTGKIMDLFEDICIKEKPNLIIVVGDVNSTLACSLVAIKLQIKIAHIESGLRSFNRKMPEEINRILVDHISDYLFVSEQAGVDNLTKEGIDNYYLVGNIMINNLINNKDKLSLSPKKDYIVVTIHRPENTGDVEKMKNIRKILTELSKKIKIVFPAHPRIAKEIESWNLNIDVLGPLGYIDFINLVGNSRAVVTDSGGIQEETTYLGIPCLTLRDETERPSTVDIGTNTIVGLDIEKIMENIDNILNDKYKKSKVPIYWDNNVAKRIMEILQNAHEI